MPTTDHGAHPDDTDPDEQPERGSDEDQSRGGRRGGQPHQPDIERAVTGPTERR